MSTTVKPDTPQWATLIRGPFALAVLRRWRARARVRSQLREKIGLVLARGKCLQVSKGDRAHRLRLRVTPPRSERGSLPSQPGEGAGRGARATRRRT